MNTASRKCSCRGQFCTIDAFTMLILYKFKKCLWIECNLLWSYICHCLFKLLFVKCIYHCSLFLQFIILLLFCPSWFCFWKWRTVVTAVVSFWLGSTPSFCSHFSFRNWHLLRKNSVKIIVLMSVKLKLISICFIETIWWHLSFICTYRDSFVN